jgi:hypothetical protein
MTKMDWNRPRKVRDAVEPYDAPVDLLRLVRRPSRPARSKAKERADAERALAAFLQAGGKIKRTES